MYDTDAARRSVLSGVASTSGAGKAGTSLSLRHQRLSFGFSGVRFSHREDRGLDDRNYTRLASAEKDERLLNAAVRARMCVLVCV